MSLADSPGAARTRAEALITDLGKLGAEWPKHHLKYARLKAEFELSYAKARLAVKDAEMSVEEKKAEALLSVQKQDDGLHTKLAEAGGSVEAAKAKYRAVEAELSGLQSLLRSMEAA